MAEGLLFYFRLIFTFAIIMLDLRTQLSNYLFWDVDINDIDWDKNASYVIERVFSRGMWEDFKVVLDYYGKSRIKKIIIKLRYLDKRTLHFCSVYFDIPLNKFRCYNIRQSNRLHWNY